MDAEKLPHLVVLESQVGIAQDQYLTADTESLEFQGGHGAGDEKHLDAFGDAQDQVLDEGNGGRVALERFDPVEDQGRRPGQAFHQFGQQGRILLPRLSFDRHPIQGHGRPFQHRLQGARQQPPEPGWRGGARGEPAPGRRQGSLRQVGGHQDEAPVPVGTQLFHQAPAFHQRCGQQAGKRCQVRDRGHFSPFPRGGRPFAEPPPGGSGSRLHFRSRGPGHRRWGRRGRPPDPGKTGRRCLHRPCVARWDR